MMKSWVRIALAGLTLTLGLAIVSSASAATYCVGTTGCDTAHTKATVQAGLNAVATSGHAGTVRLGAHSFNEALNYLGTVPVTIIGAGIGATTLTSNTGPEVLVCSAPGRMTIRSLTVKVPSGLDVGIAGGQCPIAVNGVDVNSDFAVHALGIEASHGSSTISNSVITADEAPTGGPSQPSTAVRADNGARLTVTDSQLLGQLGIWGDGHDSAPTIVGHRLNITSSGGDGQGVDAEGAHITVDDSLIAVTAGARPLEASSKFASSTLTARQMTLIGDGATPAISAFANSGTSGRTVSLTLTDSILRSSSGSSGGFEDPICASETGETVTLTIDYTDMQFPSAPPCFGSGTSHYTFGPHNVNNVNPLFVDAASGNYHLTAASPVRDLDPTPLQTGESPTDLDGNPRINGHARDLGAYEYQQPGPVARTLPADHIGRTSAVLHGSVNPSGVATTYSFAYGRTTGYGHSTPVHSLPAGTAAVPVSFHLTGLLPGHVYHFTLSADNGVPTAGLDRSFRTKALHKCHVPHLIGKTLRGARRALTRAHCQLGEVSHVHDRHHRGRIVSQHPAPGRDLRNGGKVAVTVGRA